MSGQIGGVQGSNAGQQPVKDSAGYQRFTGAIVGLLQGIGEVLFPNGKEDLAQPEEFFAGKPAEAADKKEKADGKESGGGIKFTQTVTADDRRELMNELKETYADELEDLELSEVTISMVRRIGSDEVTLEEIKDEILENRDEGEADEKKKATKEAKKDDGDAGAKPAVEAKEAEKPAEAKAEAKASE